jgi:hypothetical protein
MTTRNQYELNCLIEGEDTLIIPVPAAKVKELKQVIYREGEVEVLQYSIVS